MLEDLVDFAHQRSGPGHVSQRELHAGDLKPGLNGQMGLHVGHEGAQPLGADKLTTRRRDISPVEGNAGLDRADEHVLHARPAHDEVGLGREVLGRTPVTPRYGQQRSFAPRGRDDIRSADLRSLAGRLGQGRVGAVEVTGKDQSDSPA